MYAKGKFISTLNKLGSYEIRLVSCLDPRGRKYYSGFIYNPDNGKWAYVSSESYYNPHCENKFLVREVRDNTDYSGKMNHFADGKNAPYLVHKLIRSEPEHPEDEVLKKRTKELDEYDDIIHRIENSMNWCYADDDAMTEELDLEGFGF